MEREAHGAEGTRPAGISGHRPADQCHLSGRVNGACRLPRDHLRPEAARGNARRLNLLGQGAGRRQPARSTGAALDLNDRAFRQDVNSLGFFSLWITVSSLKMRTHGVEILSIK